MCTRTDALTHKESFILPIQCSDMTSSLEPVISPDLGPVIGDRQTWEETDHSNYTASSFFNLAFLCVKNKTKLMIASFFLLAEYSGSREIHPGPYEPNARPECLLQPVP